MQNEFFYEVISPQGQPVMETTIECRYPPSQELRMLEAGFTIRIHGRKLTKANIRKEAERANPRR